MSRSTTVLLGAALSAAVALAASAQTTLRFAHTQPTGDTHHLAAVRMAELVAQATGGALRISIHPAGELGNDPAILEGVRLGTIDIGQTGNPFYTRFEPKLNALDIPFLFASHEHVYRVVDGEVGSGLLAELEKHRLKGLAFWEIGFRKITNSRRPIVTPADLQGLKIRTTPNPAHVEAFRLWGANPTPMAFTEVYLALETRAVDGQENPLNIIRSNRFHEVQRHLSFTDHAYTVSIVSMNLARFRALPEAQQKALVDAAREAAIYQRRLNREQEGQDLAAIKAAGVEVVERVDTEAFRRLALEPVKAAYVAQHGAALVDAILALR
ncbi:TRAP transporter substrate-binding protein [Elioraea sp. Yellowstone]|jgi:tripartite ATP-independent transporter DctP family solute receptor|uniref:TRAP transporter substrate-binding protein n=1 Tax=Elioraea sp. Yellowstone TaxID=2592070 RepID=UPI001154CDFA|nr:TRAP transporter substrate-binding protein [Elioraea sp. Yellowstone]TQF77456.1 TRAP transporter substrate-binding protein [Elioraea sp. Yellowstone]